MDQPILEDFEDTEDMTGALSDLRKANQDQEEADKNTDDKNRQIVSSSY